MKRRVTVILISLVSILAVFAVYFGFYGRESSDINVKTNAASGSATLTSQVEWELGTNLYTDTSSSPGSFMIDMTSQYVDFVSETQDDTTFIGDLGMVSRIVEYTFWDNMVDWEVHKSDDGLSWTLHAYAPGTGCTDGGDAHAGTFSARYIKVIRGTGAWCGDGNVIQMKVAPIAATHTSSSTQLDAGDHDTVEWTTFVPSDSIPANTSIEYRFRTSDDHSTWGDWTTSTASAASIDISTLLGATDAAKRYLQVESTLANTDGVSTPTISAYTANYDYTDLPAETCSDGIQNQDETGVDCGGTICDACPTCDDGIQNGDETGVDCGGSCDPCEAEPTCSDGVQNGDETGVDCGGSCPACETCSDGIKNQDEEDIDCGGTICDPCDTCNNGVKDNGEQFIDCGGPCDACECRVRIFPKNCPEGQNSYLACPEGPGLFGSILPGANWDYSVTTRTQKGELRDDVFYSWGWAGGGGYYDWSLTPSGGINSSAIVRVGDGWGPYSGNPVADGAYVAASCGGSDVSYFYTKAPGIDEPDPDDETCTLSISPEESTLYLKSGYDQETFSAQAKNEDGEIITDKSITWETSGGGDLTSNNNTSTYQAKEAGSFSVTATAEGCDSAAANITTKEEYYWCLDFDCGGGPICIGPYCTHIDDKIVVTAGSVSTAALGIAALIASLLLLMQGLANVLTMIRPSQVWAYLLKGRDKKRAKGLVYDASSGIGIPLAKVLLFRSRDQKLIRVATTGSDGKFALETPPGEEYFIQVKKEGYDALTSTQGKLFDSTLTYENNYFGGEFRADDTTLLFDQVIPMSPNEDSVRLALGSRTLETVNKVLRVLNIPLLIFGFMMSTLAMIESKTPYNLVIFYLYLLIFAYYLIKLFFIDGRSFGLVINQAKRETVDLAIVRAISETRGKLAKTTVTNEKGRYTLVLPKGFYKIVTSKPNLRQPTPLSVRVKSSLRPRTERIAMIEVGRGEPEVWDKKYEARKNQNTGKALVPSPITLNSQLHTSISQPPASSSRRSFSDSGEIVERFVEKSSRFGTNNLSDIGLHHLIMPKKMEEEISETNKEISSSNPNKKESDSDHPNWQLPNSSSPL